MLKKCAKCGRRVPRKSEKCPYCGSYSRKNETSVMMLVRQILYFLILFGLFYILVIIIDKVQGRGPVRTDKTFD